MNIAAQLQSCGVPLIVERVWIENISSCGARIHSQRPWETQQQLVLSGIQGDFRIDAKVVYCQRLGPEDCAIGLKFNHPVATEQLTYSVPWN